MKIRHCLMVLGAVLLAGCSRPAAAIIVAINHTKWAINHFSVDGQSGIDAIGPYQAAVAAMAILRRRSGGRG